MKKSTEIHRKAPQLHAYHYLVAISITLGIILWILPYISFLANKEFSFLYGGIGAGAVNFDLASEIRKYLPAAFLAAGIGLLFFAPWSRWLFLVCYVIGAATITFGGFIVSSPTDHFLYFFVTLIDGAILGLVFLSPLSRQFIPTK